MRQYILSLQSILRHYMRKIRRALLIVHAQVLSAYTVYHRKKCSRFRLMNHILIKKEAIILFDSLTYLKLIALRTPTAQAMVKGSSAYPEIEGIVDFYQTTVGILICANISGLPHTVGACHYRIFGFHIHEGMSCTGNETDPFADALMHYNPRNCPHPEHAGDLPPLFENEGYAFMIFLTQRFTVDEVMGRTVIIHDMPDDFTTQPSGNSGNKIACGVIEKY